MRKVKHGGITPPRHDAFKLEVRLCVSGVLSPLLSNILLSDLDRELERRGHTFCRYADHCNIYVASERAGVGLLQRLTEFLAERLKLTGEYAQEWVARPWQRKFLGYSMPWRHEPKLRIAASSLERLTEKVNARAQSWRHGPDLQPPPAWLVSVLQADAYQADAGRAGWLDTAEVTLRPVATVEATLCAGAQFDAAGTDGGAGMALGVRSTRPVAECGRESHERSFPQVLVRSSGAGFAARYRAALSAHFMNRRMRNRTYGGVGGWRR